jgi:hypothetical protein
MGYSYVPTTYNLVCSCLCIIPAISWPILRSVAFPVGVAKSSRTEKSLENKIIIIITKSQITRNVSST